MEKVDKPGYHAPGCVQTSEVLAVHLGVIEDIETFSLR
jgi:hypothetical protein